MTPAIRIQALNKTFDNGRKALQDVNLRIHAGEMVALIGASGSGKSTLLRHMAGLTAGDPARGSDRSLVQVHGRTVQHGGKVDGDIRAVRAGVGFVFQQFNLVDRSPVIVNVLAGMLHRIPPWRSLLRCFTRGEVAQGIEALRRVGIADCSAQRAGTLSGGQQQRAAIARAMVQGAKVVLADEPIASLDPESSRKVMEILATLNREDGCTVVVTLHQVNVAMKYCPRTIALHQGRVAYDGPSAALTPALLRQLYGAEADDILAAGDAISSLDDRRSQLTDRGWPQAALQAA